MRPGRVLALSVLLACATCGPPKAPEEAPSARPQEAAVPRPVAPPAAEATGGGAGREPLIRVGLAEDAVRVVLGAAEGLEVLSLEGRVVARAGDLEQVEISGEGAPATASFEVQLASLSGPAAAETARRRAASQGLAPGIGARVVSDPDTGRTHVRLGPFGSREGAEAARVAARSGGWDGAFVVPGPVGMAAEGSLRVRVGPGAAVAAPRRVRVRAAGGKPVAVLGAAYAGVVEVSLNLAARLTVVNELPIEEYLRGVVPNEMGPEQFPRIESLAAQAVAARTYAYRNLGQYGASGYDLCATPKCQVYKGVETHHARSDDAIARTRGLVARHGGQPIRALFTSTCGGRTENVEVIFAGDGAPYLVSVPCAADGEDVPATGARSGRYFAEDGDLVNEEVALARLAGLPVPEQPVRAWLEQKAGPAELARWLAEARDAAALPPRALAPLPAALSRRALVRALVDALDLAGRIGITTGGSPSPSSDLLALAPDRGAVATDAAAWAYLLDRQALVPFPDGELRPASRPTRAALLRAITRGLLALGQPPLARGTYVGHEGAELVWDEGGSPRRGRLRPGALLFRDVRGEAVPSPDLPLRPGDSIWLGFLGGEIAYMKGVDLGKGASYDRFSRHASWEVTYDRAELEAKIAGRVTVKGLRDVEVLRRSSTGRAVALLVRAASGDVTLTGLDVRFALGVRENLFEVERQVGVGGAVERFRFVGRGFGHGVGMCQVGAYGMALGGASHAEILGHYYPGIELARLWD